MIFAHIKIEQFDYQTSLIFGNTRPNPNHRRKRLLIYRRCCYLFIFPLLIYCCPRYIFFAQDGRRKWGRAGSGSGPKPAV